MKKKEHDRTHHVSAAAYSPEKAYVAFQKKIAAICTIHRVNTNSVLADPKKNT